MSDSVKRSNYLSPSVANDLTITERDVLLFNHILSVTGGGVREFYQAISTIAETCFVRNKPGRTTERMASKCLESLCSAGYISKTSEPGGRGKTATYTVNLNRVFSVQKGVEKSRLNLDERGSNRSKKGGQISAERGSNLDKKGVKSDRQLSSQVNIISPVSQLISAETSAAEAPQPALLAPADLPEDLHATLTTLTDRPTDFLEKKESEPQELQTDYSRPEYAGLSPREIRARERGRLALIAERKEWAQEQKSKQSPPRAEKEPEATQVPDDSLNGPGGQKNGLKNDYEVGSLVGIGAILKNFSFSS